MEILSDKIRKIYTVIEESKDNIVFVKHTENSIYLICNILREKISIISDRDIDYLGLNLKVIEYKLRSNIYEDVFVYEIITYIFENRITLNVFSFLKLNDDDIRRILIKYDSICKDRIKNKIKGEKK